MVMADIKTFLVDGGMGGCGKSLAARGIVDMYQHGADDGYLSIVDHNIPRCKVFVWDASNEPDADTGYKRWGGVTTTITGRLGTDQGAKAYESLIERAKDTAKSGPVRVIIDLPNVSHSEFLRKHLKPELLQELNTIPVWLLDGGYASVASLADRVQSMPEIYRDRGVLLRNSHFGREETFSAWETSMTRVVLMRRGYWLDLFMLHLSAWPQKKMRDECLNMPLDLANKKALKDGSWIGLWRMSIQLWRGAFMNRMNIIEKL
jgi:hypothetical protein